MTRKKKTSIQYSKILEQDELPNHDKGPYYHDTQQTKKLATSLSIGHAPLLAAHQRQNFAPKSRKISVAFDEFFKWIAALSAAYVWG